MLSQTLIPVLSMFGLSRTTTRAAHAALGWGLRKSDTIFFQQVLQCRLAGVPPWNIAMCDDDHECFDVVLKLYCIHKHDASNERVARAHPQQDRRTALPAGRRACAGAQGAE